MSEPDLSALQPLAGGAADPAPAAPRRRVVVRKRPAAVVASVEPAPEPPPAALADGATLADRVWRQARNGLDRDRLLPADDKRRRDLAKRLDKPLDRNGWRMFAAGCAWTVENGKAPQRRNAEIQLVETVARWAADVAELLPERMAELRIIVDHGLSHPEPPPRKDGDK